jgi:hypothetical protein
VKAEKDITQQKENSEIIRAFSKYEKAKKAINMLDNENHHSIKDIENLLKQIDKINTSKIQNSTNPIHQIERKLYTSLKITFILKCESLLENKFLHKKIIRPFLKYPPSVERLPTKGGVIDPEALKKNPEVFKAYTKAHNDYEQKRKMFLWNYELKEIIGFEKKLIFFHFKAASRKKSVSRIPLIILSINDKDKRKEWLKELLKIMRPH